MSRCSHPGEANGGEGKEPGHLSYQHGDPAHRGRQACVEEAGFRESIKKPKVYEKAYFSPGHHLKQAGKNKKLHSERSAEPQGGLASFPHVYLKHNYKGLILSRGCKDGRTRLRGKCSPGWRLSAGWESSVGQAESLYSVAFPGTRGKAQGRRKNPLYKS